MQISALPTDIVRAWQRGGPDAHGQKPETAISDGHGNPCRHCLQMIPEGAPFLILAHRPFGSLQPYAECGPIFVCASECARYEDDGSGMPEALMDSPDFLIKGYTSNERIVYGTGAVVRTDQMAQRAAAILSDPAVDFIHIRSARNNCYQARMDRD